MELNTEFNEFLQKIRLTEDQKDSLKDAHRQLRGRLRSETSLQEILVSDFLQGSYRRHTAIRGRDSEPPDVDIIVVTNLNEDVYSPRQAMDLFEPFLNKHYPGKWQIQSRSFGITLSSVTFDLVITSAPSEADQEIVKSEAVFSQDTIDEARDWRLTPSWLSLETRKNRKDSAEVLLKAENEVEWKANPLHIPDRDVHRWEETHPLAQIIWTRDMNQKTDGHFVNAVKCIKWWRLVNYSNPKHPKSFPLERIIGDCCPVEISSVAEGVTRTLENIITKYANHYASRTKPVLPDYGVQTHNVLSRLETNDFLSFYDQAQVGAKLARKAFDADHRPESARLWRELLGEKFPVPPEDGGSKNTGYTEPSGPANPSPRRFA